MAENNPRQGQVGGDHYKKLKIQPVEYIHANNIGFAEGSAIKYLTRWRDKGGIEDLKKAKHFIELLIDLETKTTESGDDWRSRFEYMKDRHDRLCAQLTKSAVGKQVTLPDGTEATVVEDSADVYRKRPDSEIPSRPAHPEYETIDHRGEPEGGPVPNLV